MNRACISVIEEEFQHISFPRTESKLRPAWCNTHTHTHTRTPAGRVQLHGWLQQIRTKGEAKTPYTALSSEPRQCFRFHSMCSESPVVVHRPQHATEWGHQLEMYNYRPLKIPSLFVFYTSFFSHSGYYTTKMHLLHSSPIYICFLIVTTHKSTRLRSLTALQSSYS